MHTQSWLQQLSWLPIDTAATAIVEISLRFAATIPQTHHEVPVYHVLNPNLETSWSDVLEYLSRAGLAFTSVTPLEWLSRLREEEPRLDAPTRNLLAHWKILVSGISRISFS